ncbi:hypothetical protein BDW74DRAFT_175231 [Aspergillus multicolor]|uniref:uncharacterized protein n=1 Tax=Aspergillus multicolor TaxID=41759 RepID=UPI003CCCBD85
MAGVNGLKTSFTAVTDGGLRAGFQQLILSILEVKVRLRGKRKHAILMQEGSEMATWWFKFPQELPVFRGHRLLTSQDRHQPAPNSTLKCEHTGPWNILIPGHMAQLGDLIIVIMKHCGAEIDLSQEIPRNQDA